MTILLSEPVVRQILSMEDALFSVESFFKHVGIDAVNTPRTRSSSEGSVLHAMHASLPYLGRAGVKSYLSTRGGTKFVFLLYDLKGGELLAVLGADFLGRYRTGASSGVATKYLCGLKSFRLCLIGSGSQAATQVLGLAKVANVEGVAVWSPTRSSRESFAQSVTRDYGLDCKSSESLQEAFDGCEVVTTITSATAPFVTRDLIRDALHLNACGSNRASRAELTPDAVSLFSTVCVDDLSQAKMESGDLIQAANAGAFSWETAIELGQAIRAGSTWKAKSLFKSNGVAGEDVALASFVYDKAIREGLSGESFDFSGTLTKGAANQR